jgi:hypothetical protein
MNLNKALLWHGSRNANYVGILSEGLKIAPPDAPVTGYMFGELKEIKLSLYNRVSNIKIIEYIGKGIYFTEVASKAANYCHTSFDNPHGMMLLCDVALGCQKLLFFLIFFFFK